MSCSSENPLETPLKNINYHREYIDQYSGSQKDNYDLYESVFIENQNEPYIYYLLSKIENKDKDLNLGSNYFDMGINKFPLDPYLNVTKISREKGLNKPESLESWIKLSEVHPSSPIITFNVLRTYSIIPDSIKNRDIVNHFNIVKSIDQITENFYRSESNSEFYDYSLGYYDLREDQMKFIDEYTISNKKEKNKLENSSEIKNMLKKIDEERKEKERIENQKKKEKERIENRKKKEKERIENRKKKEKELYETLYNSTYWFNDRNPVDNPTMGGSFIEFLKNGGVRSGNDDGTFPSSVREGTFEVISNSKIRIRGIKESRNGIYEVVNKKGYRIYIKNPNDNGYLWFRTTQRTSYGSEY